jgi:predicted protein tyrosine phosphatase
MTNSDPQSSGEHPRRRPRLRPHDDSYAVGDDMVVAGDYPGSPPATPPEDIAKKLGAFLDADIGAFVDLTDPRDRLAPYAEAIQELAIARGVEIRYHAMAIRDMDVCEPEHMNRVLDTIDEHVGAGRRVYVHCWGGVGRTGMVVGCWLVRHGMGGDDALAAVRDGFLSMSADKTRRHARLGSPQTEAQRRVVRAWAPHDRTLRKSS